MRFGIYLVGVLSLLEASASLPFTGSKVKKSDEDSNSGSEKASSVRGAASKVSASKEDFGISPIVETFFESPLDSDTSNSLKETIEKLSNTTEMNEFLKETRRSLHRKPELMYELPFTSETIQSILDELGIPFTSGWAKNTHPDFFPGPGGYGIVAHIGSGKEDEPCIILRADMDALPINEATQGIDPFKSKTPGQMHACGHDGHVTMLLGAAALLKKVEKEIPGTVRLVFQPAEEGGAGMKRMVEEGIVTLEPKAQEAFGMHVWPTLPSGTIASRPGALMAATETFEIEISGKGGHAAMPHLTIDPIVASAALISSLQTIVSRTISPLDAGVVSITQVSAGNSFNVIPGSATIRGTIRALSTEMVISMREKVADMVAATAKLYQCTSTINFMPDFYPPTVNDEKLFEWSKGVGAMVSREGGVRDIVPTMGGEDFAFLAEAVPATFFFVGQGTGGDEEYHIPRTDYGLHHPSFALDEEVLPVGVQLHANLALRSLKKLAQESEETTLAEL
jgi:amidohydrolase